MDTGTGFDLDKLRTDPKKELDGVEHEIAPGAFVTVARHGNKRFQQMLRTLAKKYKVVLEADDDMSFEKSEQLMIECYAHTILLGWRGVKIGGVEQAYTPELGIKVLTEIKDFRDRIENFAKSAEEYRVKAEGAVVKP